MALKIKQNGEVKDLIIPACGVQILDMEDNFESNNLEEVLQEIGEGESVYISDEEPDKDGIWISSDNTATATNNPTLVALKKYIDDKLGAAELTTDDKTVKGAINKHETQINNNTAQLQEKVNYSFLINKDFQVWQRGASFTNVDSKYTADRWFSNNSVSCALYIDKVEDGLKMTLTKVATGIITQYLDEIDKKRLIGKKVSFAISVDGIRYTYTTTISTMYTYVDFELSTKTFTTKEHPTETKYYMYLGQSNAPIGTTYTINYVDDAIGESIGEFIPRPYGEELALCQRYFETGVAKGISCGSNNLMISHNYKVSKRVKATLSFASYLHHTVNKVSNFDTLADVAFTPSGINSDENYIANSMCSENNLIHGKNYAVYYTADAEIY